MNEIMQTISTTVVYYAFAYTMVFLAFALVYMANIVLGFFQNTTVQKKDVDWKLLLFSTLRLIVYYVSGMLIIAVFPLMAAGLGMFGITISEDITQSFSIVALAMVYASAFYKYGKDVLSKIKTGFSVDEDVSGSATVTEIADKIDAFSIKSNVTNTDSSDTTTAGE